MHKNKKQLIVLLCVAGWLTIALLWGMYRHALGYALEFALITSIPATAFGAVLFWWFRD